MKAAIYMRVSSEEQRERQTIELQRDFARKYCELHQIPIADIYSDDGVTGTSALSERPEGKRLLDDAAQKHFDTVLLYRIDRLGRDPLIILNSINVLESRGIQVRSMTEAFDSSSPAGRLMITMLSGWAGYDRETLLERMAGGTERAIREGAWWGVVPYGYRREGERRHARLVVADTPLPDLAMSEADVVRLIFQLSADEKKSCREIARHLNRLGVPPAYQIEGHAVGRRKRKTAGVWHPGRIRNMLVSTTYRGLHVYGRRTKKTRELVERPVPAIVDPEIWDRAQGTLRHNLIWNPRNGRRPYLLRGLLRCSICNHKLSGSAHHANRRYYVCGGKSAAKRTVADQEIKCPSRPVPADLEQVVWADIEQFLRDPGPVLSEVAGQLDDLGGQVEATRREAVSAERALATKDKERDAVLALFRRGRIDEATLDRQLEEVETERTGLTEALRDAQGRLRAVEEASSHLRSAEDLLAGLRDRLDAPLTFDLKRELVEILVEGISVNTLQQNGKRELEVEVTYRFTPPSGQASIATRTDRSAESPPVP